MGADLMVTSGAHSHDYCTSDTLQAFDAKLQMANTAYIGLPCNCKGSQWKKGDFKKLRPFYNC